MVRKMKSNKLNICLILDSIFNPNIPARPAIIEIYGKYLPSLGHKIIWISASDESEKQIQKQYFNQVKIYTIPRSIASSPYLKILNLVSYYLKEYRILAEILKSEKYDIIQVRNDAIGALIALHFKKKYKIPFVFQYSFPKEAFKLQKLEKRYSYYFGEFIIYIQKYILRKADLILPISKWMEDELVNEGILKSKMMSFPMGVNPELFSFEKNNSRIREKYCLTESCVILYIGSMHKLRSLDIIIHAFSRVIEKNPKIKLLMVGDGNDKQHLDELSVNLGINKNIIFTGQVSYFDIPDFIAAADVCLCPVPPLSIYKVSSPTKMFEYMVCGKPVVSNEEIPEQKEVIEESGGGILVEFEAESFAYGIIELLDNPDKAKEMGIKGHEWVVKNRSYENMAREVETKYFELLENK